MMKKRLIFGGTFFWLVCAALVDRSAAQLTDGLVGYWPLHGPTALDASGNALHGTINGDLQAAPDRSGNPAGAILFPGESASHVDLGDRPEFEVTEELTLSAWVLLDPENMTNNGRILAKQAGGGARSWSLNIESDGAPATFQVSPDGGTIASVSGSGIPRDEWVHLAGVFRPGEAQEVYVNGLLDTANMLDVPLMHHSANDSPVLIGARAACGNCGWPGAIDDVAMWNRALSGAEVLELYEDNVLGPLVAGDANFDEVVDMTDYAVIRDNFLESVTPRRMGDLNFDGVVEWADFREWKQTFAAAGGTAAVPEPTSVSLALLVAATLGLLVRRQGK